MYKNKKMDEVNKILEKNRKKKEEFKLKSSRIVDKAKNQKKFLDNADSPLLSDDARINHKALKAELKREAEKEFHKMADPILKEVDKGSEDAIKIDNDIHAANRKAIDNYQKAADVNNANARAKFQEAKHKIEYDDRDVTDKDRKIKEIQDDMKKEFEKSEHEIEMSWP